jgi:hypothetical protein
MLSKSRKAEPETVPDTEPPVYYSPEVELAEVTKPKSVYVAPVKDRPDEMVYTLFGSILTILPLFFIRTVITLEVLPFVVFNTVLILTGVGLAIKGFILQQNLIQGNRSAREYQQWTYDMELSGQLVEVTRKDRRGLVSSLVMTVILAVVQLTVTAVILLDYAIILIAGGP